MARLPQRTRAQLDPDGQEAYDRILASRGAVRDPFATYLHHPALAERVAALGEHLRFHSTLPGADRELAILAAAHEVEAPFQWADHEPIAHRAGTRPEAIAVVRDGLPTEQLTAREALIVDVVRTLFRVHLLPDDLYARAEQDLGTQPLVELVTLAGYYAMLGFFLNAFQVEPP